MSPSTGNEFLESTKYQNMETGRSKGADNPPPLELPHTGTAEPIQLPDPQAGQNPVGEIIETRQSYRTYTQASLTLDELSFLLWSTQGVKRIVRDQTTFRTVPSAGSRHALETLILVNRCEDLPPGLYRFLALEHQLAPRKMNAAITEEIRRACLNQASIEKSAVTFIWFAVTERMTWRYNQRGYRYLFLDAGHVCQNLYLAAESIDCGVCAIGAFDDDSLNEVLNLDGKHQFAIYAGTVGKKTDQST